MTEFKDAIQNPMSFFDQEVLRVGKVLERGQEITPGEAVRIGITNIVFVGNSRLKPENFYLRARDYQAVQPLVYPGKSAILDFMRLSQRGTVSPKERGMITQLSFG